MDECLPFEFEYDGDVVNDDIPDNNEIRHAVFQMRSRKAPGLTRVSVDIIKVWYKLGFPKKGEPDLNV